MLPNREQFVELAEKLASQLIQALETLRLVEGFVEDYAAEYDRAGLTTHPVRHRELVATIRREVLLAMGARVSAARLRRLSGRRRRTSDPHQEQDVAALREALVVALGERVDWSAGERESFGADLRLYARLAGRAPRPAKRRQSAQLAQGPFVDRCALLLDPAMLEQARRAAGGLLLEVERVTDRILARVFRRRR